MSASDAVDGSSTGTEAPWMWVVPVGNPTQLAKQRESVDALA
jgi:hypothetical protein